MLIRHIGFGVRGFYTPASFDIKEASQQKCEALIFWEKHGLQDGSRAPRMCGGAIGRQ